MLFVCQKLKVKIIALILKLNRLIIFTLKFNELNIKTNNFSNYFLDKHFLGKIIYI